MCACVCVYVCACVAMSEDVMSVCVCVCACVAMSEDVMVSLKNLEDCIKFLWGEAGGEKVRKSIDKLVDMVQIDGTMRSLLVSQVRGWGRLIIREQGYLRISRLRNNISKNNYSYLQ